jgi:phage terminase large subunit
VRVRGLPPKQGVLQFISSAIVHAAVLRVVDPKAISDRIPRLMSLDVARQGDDSSCLLMRQGRKLLELADGDYIKRFQIRNITQLCLHVSKIIHQNYPDIVFVDGTGIGAGAVDYLRTLGHDNIVEVHGGSEPQDKLVFLNKRIEMWDRCRQWLEGADIPDDPQLIVDLTTPEFGFQEKTQKMKLESKEDMKKRGADSPDSGDALVQTFFHSVPSKTAFVRDDSYEPEEV